LTRLERLARDKHTNLSQKPINYRRKKFYRIGPRSQNFILFSKFLKLKRKRIVNLNFSRNVKSRSFFMNPKKKVLRALSLGVAKGRELALGTSERCITSKVINLYSVKGYVGRC
jgi:hypothetical protein